MITANPLENHAISNWGMPLRVTNIQVVVSLYRKLNYYWEQHDQTLRLDPPRHCLLPCIVVRGVLLPLDTYSSSSSHANWTLFLMLELGFSSEEDLSKNKSFAGLSIFSNICMNIIGTMSSVYNIVMVSVFLFLINSLVKNI